MSHKIIVPTLGESVTEATVSKWLNNTGDKVVSDEKLIIENEFFNENYLKLSIGKKRHIKIELD